MQSMQNIILVNLEIPKGTQYIEKGDLSSVQFYIMNIDQRERQHQRHHIQRTLTTTTNDNGNDKKQVGDLNTPMAKGLADV